MTLEDPGTVPASADGRGFALLSLVATVPDMPPVSLAVVLLEAREERPEEVHVGADEKNYPNTTSHETGITLGVSFARRFASPS